MAHFVTKISDIIEFNPRETIARKQVCKKVPMEYLQPFTRQISGFEEAPYAGGTKFRNNDTIMARITPCLENGKTAFVKGFAENEVVFGSTEYIVMRAIPGASDPVFIYYLATSPSFREVAIKSMVGSSGRQRVQQDVLENLELVLPDYETQVRVGKVLSAFDDKIELNTQINHNLEEQAKCLVKSWFVDFEPYGGQIPDSWHEITLSEIADFIGGYSYKGAELQPSSCAMATIKNFDRTGGFKLDGYKEIIPSDKLKDSQKVELFDILVAHTDLTQKAEVIGNAEMVLSKSGYDEIIMSMDLVKVLPKHGISRFVLAALLRTDQFKDHALGYVNGTTVLHMSKKALPAFTLYFPEKFSELSEISCMLEAIYKKIAQNIEESRSLVKLRDTLLPKLMSGEIDVSEVEI